MNWQTIPYRDYSRMIQRKAYLEWCIENHLDDEMDRIEWVGIKLAMRGHK